MFFPIISLCRGLYPNPFLNPAGQSQPLLNLTCPKISINYFFTTILTSNILPVSVPDSIILYINFHKSEANEIRKSNGHWRIQKDCTYDNTEYYFYICILCTKKWYRYVINSWIKGYFYLSVTEILMSQITKRYKRTD